MCDYSPPVREPRPIAWRLPGIVCAATRAVTTQVAGASERRDVTIGLFAHRWMSGPPNDDLRGARPWVHGPRCGIFHDTDNSVGPSLAAGVSLWLSPLWVLGVDGRHAWLSPTVKVDGHRVGDLRLEPMAIGTTLEYRF